ncbi:MAG: recombinase family protein, partial [Anaerolineae bacterium]|nr:recombinase family protein [Anaerolineae bacterium]
EEGILSKGDTSAVVAKKFGPGSWSPSTVRRIISNAVYKGTWYYGKTRRCKVNGKTVQVRQPKSDWIAVEVPAIVDEATWEDAQKCLAKNKSMAKRNTRRNYLLRGMVFCPCGRRWVGRYKNHLKRAYYRCPSTEKEHWRKKCENRFGIRQEVLENGVWEKLVLFFLEPENLRNEIERKRAEAEKEIARKAKRLDAIAQVIADIDRKLSILLDEILTGEFSQAVINQKKKALVAERNSLLVETQSTKRELEAMAVTPEAEQELLSFAKQMAKAVICVKFQDKRRICELLQLRVDVIHREKVKLTGMLPAEGLIVDLSSA